MNLKHLLEASLIAALLLGSQGSDAAQAEGATFTRITGQPIVTDLGPDLGLSYGCAWGDFDNDGYLDLIVANARGRSVGVFLYRNNHDGTFTGIIAGQLGTDGGAGVAMAWGDMDNDGHLDLFLGEWEDFRTCCPGLSLTTSALYRHTAPGTFERFFFESADRVGGCAWADFDRDRPVCWLRLG